MTVHTSWNQDVENAITEGKINIPDESDQSEGQFYTHMQIP